MTIHSLKLPMILIVLLIGGTLQSAQLKVKDGEKIAILSGQHFKIYNWGPSGYLRLMTDALKTCGIKKFPFITLEGKTTAQILSRLDTDVIAKKPVTAFVIPGTRDFNPWHKKPASESYRQNLTDIVKRLTGAGIHTVLITSHVDNSNLKSRLNASVITHNDFIRKLAAETKITLLDFSHLIIEEEKKCGLPFDGNQAAQGLVSQCFAAEVLKILGVDDLAVTSLREQWQHKPGAITFKPSVSINTYEKLKAQAKAANQSVADYMATVLHEKAR